MKKTLIIFSALFLLACGKTITPAEEAKQYLDGNKKVEPPAIAKEVIKTGLPTSYPADLPLPTGVDQTKVYSDTTANDGHSVFFAMTAPLDEAYSAYLDQLKAGGFEVTQNKKVSDHSAFIDFQKSGKLFSVYFQDSIPTTYPKDLNLQGLYVTIMYDLKPAPTF